MSAKKRDYYQVLGIDKKSTSEQIKKAYKKQAIKWHPDKNPNNKQQATLKFRQLAEAYQVLSDQQKRNTYDKYGHDGPQFSSSDFGSFNFHDADWVFKDFFSHNPFDNEADDDFFGSFFGRKGKSKGGFGSFGSMGGFGKSMFDDDFFSKEMGGMGGGQFSSFTSSSSFGGGPGLKKSVSTTTKTVNGKTVTTKKTQIFKQDGTKQVTQQVIEGANKTVKKYSLGNGSEFKSVRN